MAFRDWLTRRNVLIASIAVVVAVLGAYFAFRRPPRVAMERYVPATALGFIEIDALSDLVDGLTDTKAWRELAPALGLSSQIRQIGLGADLMGRTGLGPAEAVLAARAQYAIVVTGIDASTGATDEGPYINFKPRFVLMAETHAKPETVAGLVKERALLIAQRVYGESVAEDSLDYQGSPLLIFHGPTPDRELVAASYGSVALIGNNTQALKSCLETIAGRTPTLADDKTLKEKRSSVDRDASVFVFVTESGVNKLAELGPAIIASTQGNVERANSFADLIQNVSKETVAGLLYSAEFTSDGVTERFLTVLRPRVAESLMPAFQAPRSLGISSLSLVPPDAREATLLNIDRIGELPERALKQIAPNLDVVAGVALRQFVINFRKQYGLESTESAGDAIGDELALVDFGDGQPRAMLTSVRDKTRLTPFVDRYLNRQGAEVTAEAYGGSEIRVSSSDDRLAAAFIGDYLALGTRAQIAKMIDTQASGAGLATAEQLKRALVTIGPIVTFRPENDAAGRLMLGISKLTRVTDGSPRLLESDQVRAALKRLPPTVSTTEFRDYGIYSETRSAVGNFSVLASLLGAGDEEEQQ